MIVINNLMSSARDHCMPEKLPEFQRLVDAQYLKMRKALKLARDDRNG